jgi:hypothetical protein
MNFRGLKLWEVGNDDTSNNDESDAVLAGGHMFSIDNPRTDTLDVPPALFFQYWYYRNFREFVRVRLDGQRPIGYDINRIPNGLDPFFIDGSQSSSKAPWHSRIHVGWFFDAKSKRVPAGLSGDNKIGPGQLGDLEVLNDPR